MKKIIIVYILLTISFCIACSEKELRDGDIIFQTSLSSQSKAIQEATHSRYSHMGIVFKINEKFYVYEAVKRVQLTPLETWISRGEKNRYAVKRLKNADKVLTPSVIKKMISAGKKYRGKRYDIYFGWGNDVIYCSELVWKIYREALGVEIGELKKLKEFDLDSPLVRKILKKRYGKNIPLDEPVISPGDMFNSKLLVRIR